MTKSTMSDVSTLLQQTGGAIQLPHSDSTQVITGYSKTDMPAGYSKTDAPAIVGYSKTDAPAIVGYSKTDSPVFHNLSLPLSETAADQELLLRLRSSRQTGER